MDSRSFPCPILLCASARQQVGRSCREHQNNIQLSYTETSTCRIKGTSESGGCNVASGCDHARTTEQSAFRIHKETGRPPFGSGSPEPCHQPVPSSWPAGFAG